MKYFYKISAIVLLFFTIFIQASDFSGSDIFLQLLNEKRLELMPITADFRNYFLFHSIEDTSEILVADFVGAEKKVVLLIDENADNTVDITHEYYPDSKKKRTPAKTQSDLVYNLEDMKRDIITGKIFRETYSYKMSSFDTLERVIRRGSDYFKYEHGYTVKVYDPDKPNTIMSEFFFGRKDGAYDLIFKTRYYKLYHNVIKPPLSFSVYCKNSHDPVVKETVEKLIKIVEQ
jgi:hypothetical protein